MAKRGTTLSPKKKSRHSHKTKKRLAVKHAMLAERASRKKEVRLAFFYLFQNFWELFEIVH